MLNDTHRNVVHRGTEPFNDIQVILIRFLSPVRHYFTNYIALFAKGYYKFSKGEILGKAWNARSHTILYSVKIKPSIFSKTIVIRL